MSARWRTLAALALIAAANAWAAGPPLQVVQVHYLVSEQSPERVEASVTTPLERVLVSMPRATAIHSATTHGRVELEIHFEGGATDEDVATVTQRVDQARLAGEVRSRTVRLAAPRLQP